MNIICMPLVKNLPTPKEKDWKKIRCPVCKRECWITSTHLWAQKINIIKQEQTMCTECALTIEIGELENENNRGTTN